MKKSLWDKLNTAEWSKDMLEKRSYKTDRYRYTVHAPDYCEHIVCRRRRHNKKRMRSVGSQKHRTSKELLDDF